MAGAFQAESQAKQPGEEGIADKAHSGLREQRVSGPETGECWTGKRVAPAVGLGSVPASEADHSTGAPQHPTHPALVPRC